MPRPSVETLDRFSASVISNIDYFLLASTILGSMVDSYRASRRSDEADEQDISEASTDDQQLLRLRFECLCFCAYSSIIQSPKYLTERKWFSNRVNPVLVQRFGGAIATALAHHCSATTMGALREITLTGIHPERISVLGEPVQPRARLSEYQAASLREFGGELERFGKHIGKALDASRIGILDVIGVASSKPLLMLSGFALEKALREG